MKKEKITMPLVCSCGTIFSDEQMFCTNCGASKADQQQRKYDEILAKEKDAKTLKALAALREDCDVISGFGDIDDRKKALDERIAALKQKKKKKAGRIIGISSAAVAVAVIAVLVVIFVMPFLPHYMKAGKAFKSADYLLAIEEYKQAETFLDSGKKLLKTYYTYGASLQEEGNFLAAADAFHSSRGYEDADERITACGNSLLGQKQYTNASKVFAMLSTEESKQYVNYAKGMAFVEKGDFGEALDYFEKAGEVEDTATRILQSHYALGKTALTTDVDSARTHFKAAGSYKDAQNMLKVCDLMEAENEARQGNLNKALTMFKKLPANLSYKQISAGARVKLLESNSTFLNICGKWKQSNDENQTISIKCILNNDGTFTLKGTITYVWFVKYNYYSGRLTYQIESEDFELKNLKAGPPAEFKVGSYVFVSFSGGVFSFDVFNYVSGYGRIIHSSGTYGTKVEKY